MLIHPGDRHHLHARVGEKTFVCLMYRLNSEMSFVNRDLCFSREVEHDVARDAVQQAAGKCRGAKPASSDEKEIADGAFRQMRFPIEQDAVERASGDRFPFRQDIVQKVGGLDLRVRARWAGSVSFGRRSGSRRYDIVRVEEGEAVWS